MAERLDFVEREACATDLLLFNVSESPDEDLREVVRSIAGALQIKLNPGDIVTSMRVGSETRVDGKARSALVKLNSSELRSKVIQKKRIKRDLIVGDVPLFSSSSDPGVKIYVHQ